MTAAQARAAMLEFHASRETNLHDLIISKVTKTATQGYKSCEKSLKGYEQTSLDQLGSTLSAAGFVVTMTPFEDNPSEGCKVVVSW